MQEELTVTGGKVAKWHDFKVALGNPDGSEPGTVPSFFDGDSWVNDTSGEFENAKMTNSAGNLTGFHVVGNTSNSYSVLEEYARLLMSRKADSSAESGPQPYEGFSGDNLDQDELAERGDQPPYDEDYSFWHGGADADTDTRMVYAGSIVSGLNRDTYDPNESDAYDEYNFTRSGSRRLSTGVFTAPLGFVKVVGTCLTTAGVATTLPHGTAQPALVMHAKKGSYKGVSARPYVKFSDLTKMGATAKSLQ